ncbi:MAG: sialate O-acetylesterase [Kiritimatiellales bacterium]|nr:sialate O-acetylesterase [Kiritimatiellales bacterium]
MKKTRITTLTCLLALCGTAGAGKVQVFILTGQSNMEGKGLAAHLDTYRNDPLIKEAYPKLKDGDGWAVRDDVWITYPVKKDGAQNGRLTAGYGTKGENSIGPEFGFGHTVGDAINAPVVLIKIAWNGKSLAVDFRPPSAGFPDHAVLEQMLVKARKKKPETTLEEIKARHGEYYRQLVTETKKALGSLGTTFPELSGKEYGIEGIVWHQGFNDKVNRRERENGYADYPKWLALFIKDIRKDLGAPNAPFVIGELSTGGIPGCGEFQIAQAKAAELPEFQGNVAFVPTAKFYDTKAHELYEKNYWKGTAEQKAQWIKVGNDRPYHYLGSGKTYYLKGCAFGKAMLEMMGKQD